MSKFLIYSAAFATVAGLVLGVFWLIWQLYCWVLPQVYPSGPENLIQPPYWLFVGAWVLVSSIGKAVFGRSGESK